MKYVVEDIFRYTYKPDRTRGKKARRAHSYVGIPFNVQLNKRTGELYIDVFTTKRDGIPINEFEPFFKFIHRKDNIAQINRRLQEKLANFDASRLPENKKALIMGIQKAGGIIDDENIRPVVFEFRSTNPDSIIKEINRIFEIYKELYDVKNVNIYDFLKILGIDSNQINWRDRKRIAPIRTFKHRQIHGSSKL